MVAQLGGVIEALRQRLQGEKNLACPTRDDFLVRFIRASNYDVEQSYILVLDYFKAKRDHPEEFEFGPASDYMEVMSDPALGFVLPQCDHLGRRIMLLRLGGVDPFTQEWTHVIQTAALILEAYSLDEEVQESGVSLIIDSTDFSLKIMKWATPHKLKVIVKFLEDSIPLRFESLHIVNAPLIFNMFWAAIKPFMNDKIIEKISWHKAPFSKLHASIEPRHLPPWMGGTLDPDSAKFWYKEVLEKEDILKGYTEYGYKKIARYSTI